MDPITQKIKQWIEEGKDPRIAHWQGGLEAILNIFLPYLEPGRLIPAQPLEEDEFSVFTKALEVVDLSPNLHAAFLPASIAAKVTPPASADKIQRIEEGKPSCKLLIARPGKEMRIMCVEISAHARKPGVDIFESGVLLGTYDFDNPQDCFAALNKIVRTHIWEKGTWNRDDFKRYTVNWFEKVLNLPGSTICVEKDFSFLHSPTLIRSNRIDAVFTLIFEIFMKRANDPDGPLREAVSAIRAIPDADVRAAQFHNLAEKSVFAFLTAIKRCGVVKFDTFSDKENERFDGECAGTIRRIVSGMVSNR
ncbi:MAG: hypothetical protein WA081_14370 [Desulfosalsimonadaceae bacterium]